MVKDKALYISIDVEEYKRNKLHTLQSQEKVLTSIRHLQNLKYLYSQEAKLKARLHKSFETILKALEKLEDELPDPRLPKAIKEKLSSQQKFSLESTKEKEYHEKIKKEVDEKQSSIDLELQQIQEKLKMLNA